VRMLPPFLSAYLVVGLFAPAMMCVAQPEIQVPYVVDERRYIAENDRTIRVTSTGNLTGLESPAGFEHLRNASGRAREGYRIRYVDATGATREVFHFGDTASSSIVPSSPDLLPEPLIGPPTGTRYAVGTVVTAKAAVRTRDNRLRIEQELRWVVGLDQLIKVKVINISGAPLTILWFDRLADLNVSAGGVYGTRESRNSFIPIPTGVVSVEVRCRVALCPPPCNPGDPSCDPLKYVSQLGVRMTGEPAPSAVLIQAGGTGATPLATRKDDIDGVVTLRWNGPKILTASGAQSFTEYDIAYSPR
jgi:hypothetical protein